LKGEKGGYKEKWCTVERREKKKKNMVWEGEGG
jgi:hypothetical protein